MRYDIYTFVNELMFLTKTVEPEQTMVCLRPFFRPCRAVELTQAI